jgi:hypothetical protein
MVGFLQRESVDFVVACDMTREEIVSSDHFLFGVSEKAVLCG